MRPVVPTFNENGPQIATKSNVSLADDASVSFDLDEAIWGVVVSSAAAGDTTIDEWVFFLATEAGNVAHMAASANTANSDSDTNFCVYVSGGDLVIKNRRGAARYVSYWTFDM